MFDFEKLDIYQEIKKNNLEVLKYVFGGTIKDKYLEDQLKRATLNIQLNLAEGTGRFSGKEKMHYYTVARSSVFECVALLDILESMKMLTPESYKSFYESYEKISKMLLGMYRNVNPDK
jgi:four helix bundle protein